MTFTARSASFAVILASVLASPLRSQAAPVDMNADQFRLYTDYQMALKDPKVLKMPASKRMGAIAKNFKMSEKLIKEALAKGDAAGPTIDKQCEAEVKSELAASPLKGRIGEVRVDATSNHVVTYVQWRNDDGDKLDEEAATVALIAAKAAPITSTIAVWAKSPSGTKVFEAKISADAASRFNQERIAMFARARYIRVFEDVHNLYTGTPPTD